MATDPNAQNPANSRNPPVSDLSTQNTSTIGVWENSLGSRVPPTSGTQVTIDDDSELRNFGEVVAQIQSHTNTLHLDQADTRAAMNEAFAQQKKDFPRMQLPVHLEDLVGVKQLLNEPLKDYISRFMTEAT
uniref:Uncharacterized protein n=1 Tax=Cannabis sativa TaxID=3483 RepID=A0A803NLR6_CANSA